MTHNPGEGKVQDQIISIPATISKVVTMADKSIRLQVDTQELDPDTKSRVFSLHEKLGYFFFSEAEIKAKEVLEVELPEIVLDKDEKSPSERLRSVLFIYWQQQGIKEPFDIYYRRAMDKFISQVKEKLS